MDGNLLVNRNSSLKVITKEPRSPDWEVSIRVPRTLFLHSGHDSDDNNYYLCKWKRGLEAKKQEKQDT